MTDIIEVSEAGPRGLPGSPGPIQVSVADAATLTATIATGFLPGAEGYVQAFKTTYSYDPTSVATPDGVTVIAAQGGGNWIALPGVGVLGTTLVGISKFGEDGFDFGGVVAAGTAAVYQLPLPQLSFGEQVTMATATDVQSNVAAQGVTGATNATPIVVAVASNAGYQNGSRVYINGVIGNTAANGGHFVSVSGGTDLSLYQDAALSIPVAGTGTYTGGGVLSPLDFAHFERRVTYRECRGITINAQSGTTDTDITTPAEPLNAMPSLKTATAVISVVGGTVSVSATAPTNVPIRVAGSVSYVRRPQPGVGSSPIVTSISVNSGPYAGGTPAVVSGSLFTGAVTVAIVVAGTAYPASFAFVNDGTLNITTGVGPVAGGVGDVVVTTANGQGTLGGAFTYAARPFSPLDRSPILWVKSTVGVTQGGGNATAWADQSGNANNLASGTNTYHASDASINGAPSIVGASPSGIFAADTIAQPFTIYVVGYQNGGGPAEIISGETVRVSIGVNGGQWFIYAGGSILQGGTVDSVDHAFAAVFNNPSTSALYIDDSTAVVASGSAGSNSLGKLIIGSASVSATGAVAEIVIVANADSQPQRAQLFEYFATEYANTWS